jgi:RNA polymerase sigma-70 factor (ECF subfamily)
MQELITDITQRAQRLDPQSPERLYPEAAELSALVGRLRRLARVARDAGAS